MKYGYARISTKDQSLDMQIDALKKIGCGQIYEEVAKGARTDRPVLIQLLEVMQAGDTLVIWKFDRLGRSLQHLVKIFNDLISRDINIISIKDPVDTTTPQGRLMFNIFSSLAEFEKEIIQERTNAGLQSARARGKLGGRRRGLSQRAMEKACAAESLYKEGKLSAIEISKKLEISKTTLYKYLKIRNVSIGIKNN
jgi:DNA invertase Pin-like site-specific DNA recombinase